MVVANVAKNVEAPSVRDVQAAAARLPDFVIAGAMKCATTSLHHILGGHPGVFIPPGEIKLFDIDDFELHPDNFPVVQGEWTDHDFDRDVDSYMTWYRGKFAPGGDARIIGEDSPSYLASAKAPERVRRILPDVKLIFLLRDPVARAYSHYWHLVRTRRTSSSFEESLRQQTSLVSRGCYRAALERWFALFPREQIRIVLFEQFIADTQRVTGDILEFLGLDRTASLDCTHRNESRFPRFVGLKLFENWLTRDLAGRKHWRRPGMPGLMRPGLRDRLVSTLGDWINPLRPGKPAPMPSGAEQFLTAYYRRENRGLAELIGIPVEQHWRSLQTGVR